MLTAAELTEFLALDGIDPWGPERGDFRMARICGTVARSFGGGQVNEADWLFRFGESRTEDGGAGQIEKFKRYAELSQSWEDE